MKQISQIVLGLVVVLGCSTAAFAQNKIAVSFSSEFESQVRESTGVVGQSALSSFLYEGTAKVMDVRGKVSDRAFVTATIRRTTFGDTVDAINGSRSGLFATAIIGGSVGGYHQYRGGLEWELFPGVTIGGGVQKTVFRRQFVELATATRNVRQLQESITTYDMFGPYGSATIERSIGRLTLRGSGSYIPWESLAYRGTDGVYGRTPQQQLSTSSHADGFDVSLSGSFNLVWGLGVTAGWQRQLTRIKAPLTAGAHNELDARGKSIGIWYGLKR